MNFNPNRYGQKPIFKPGSGIGQIFRPKRTVWKMNYNSFIYPFIQHFLFLLGQETELRDPNSSKLKIHKIKESLRGIKNKINEYQTLYIKIEDLATGKIIVEENNSASHQFICPHCKYDQH